MPLRPSSFSSFSMRDVVFLCLLGAALVHCNSYNWDGPGSLDTEEEHSDPDACLTDHASCGCCLMQQQLSRMETFFNMSLNTLEKDLEQAKNTLNDIKGARSAFSVALTDSRSCLGPFNVIMPVIYKHVFINLGGNYSELTGEFTAPRSGVYSFSLTVYSDAGAAGASLAACASLYKNDMLLAGPSDKNKQDQEDSATTVVALHLNAGDKVYVKLPIGCFLCDDHSYYNTFTGFLLYATD